MTRLCTALVAVVGLGLTAVTHVAQAQTCNQEFCALDMNSRIWVNNNTWGSGSSPAGWSESITIQGPNSFRTNFNWPSGPNNNSVKAFPSAVVGWHWGFRKTGTGLPTQLSANQNVNSNYAYSVAFGVGGVGNVAYDCWLHTQSNPTWEHQPSDELMIWVNSTGGAGALGTTIATNINVGGATWNLKRGNIGWEVWSFVRTSNSSSGSVNVKNFTDYLRTNYGLSSSKYLTSVQFGTEIFRGVGNLNVSNFTCTIGGGGGQTIPNGTYRLVARHSGKSADVTGNGTANGTNVAQYQNGTGTNQRWNVTHLGSGQYQIQSVSANKALDCNGSGTTNGTNVQIWTYGGGANQRWTIVPTSGGYYRVSPVHAPALALDVTGSSTANNANIQLYTYGGGNNQQWAFQAP